MSVAIQWAPPTSKKADPGAARRERVRVLEAGREGLLRQLGVNPALIALIWDPKSRNPLRKHLCEAAQFVDWIDWAAADKDGWVPLASTYEGEHGFVATPSGILELNTPEEPALVEEVWVWADVLGTGITMLLEDNQDHGPELRAIREELELARCPRLTAWFDAVLSLAANRGVFVRGAIVEEAMKRFE